MFLLRAKNQIFVISHMKILFLFLLTKFFSCNCKLSSFFTFCLQISSLNIFLDRGKNLVYSCTSICRKYLSRDVLVKFSVTIRKKGKSLIKETTFYNYVNSKYTPNIKYYLKIYMQHCAEKGTLRKKNRFNIFFTKVNNFLFLKKF